jgi:hypothetical protein
MPRDWVEDCDMGYEVSRSHSRFRYMRGKGQGSTWAGSLRGALRRLPRRSTKARPFNVVPNTAGEAKCRTEFWPRRLRTSKTRL